MKKNIFEAYINKLLDLPLWIKQVVYIKLKEDLRKHDCNEVLNKNSEDLFSLYEPILTYSGKTELMNRKVGLDNNIYNFLGMCEKNYSILEIAMNMFLTMEETSKLFVFCVEQQYLEKPESEVIYDIAKFISGKLNSEGNLKYQKDFSLNKIKEEARNRFILDYNSVPNSERKFDTEDERIAVEFDALKKENQKLKLKQLQLLELVKNHV